MTSFCFFLYSLLSEWKHLQWSFVESPWQARGLGEVSMRPFEGSTQRATETMHRGQNSTAIFKWPQMLPAHSLVFSLFWLCLLSIQIRTQTFFSWVRTLLEFSTRSAGKIWHIWQWHDIELLIWHAKDCQFRTGHLIFHAKSNKPQRHKLRQNRLKWFWPVSTQSKQPEQPCVLVFSQH